MTRDRVYLQATLVLALPVALLVFLLVSGRGSAPFEEARLHAALVWSLTAAAAAIGIVALRAHLSTGNANTAALAAGLLGFAGVAVWSGLPHHQPFMRLVYGPQARIVFALSLLALVGGARYGPRERVRNAKVIFGGAVALLGLTYLANVPLARALAASPAEDPLAVLAALEAVAAVLAGSAAILLVTRRDADVPASIILPVGIGLAAEQSLLFILSTPWTFLWWLAHLVSALSMLLVAAGVLVVWREAERDKELDRLRDLDRTKTEFINTAAHELCTPLTPIKLQLHLLKASKGDGMSDAQRKAIDVLDRNVARMDHLVQDVLDAARMQSGKLSLKREAMDLGRAMLDVAEAFEGPTHHAGVDLRLQTPPGLVVDADPKRVFQVMSNLMNNALKFTPSGGRIVLDARREGDHAVVTVRDTGLGLGTGDAAKLFRPFAQVHEASHGRGVGLGLYICRNIVGEHGGRIWCESEGPGQGAAFSFTLPLAPTPFHTTGVAPTVPAPGDED